MDLPYKKVSILVAATVVAAFLFGSCAPYQAHKGSVHFKQRGKASWYGPGFAGRKTANGERFNPGALTAAHRKLPFNTTVRVTNVANGKSVIVRINDRGPYAGGRVIDLSKAAAKKIGLIRHGVAVVEIESVVSEEKATEKKRRAYKKSASLEPGIKVAARRIRKNGVEHLISVENRKGEPFPSEVIEELEPPKEVKKTQEESKAIDDSFSVSSKKPASKPYPADQDDF